MGISPTKSYQISYHLNHLVHNVCERILHDRFQSSGLCKDILFDLVSEDEYKKMKSSAQNMIRSRCEHAIIKYTQMFESQLDEWGQCSDEYKQLLVNFIRSSRKMDLFNKSVKVRDSIAIEKLYIDYLSVWTAS